MSDATFAGDERAPLVPRPAPTARPSGPAIARDVRAGYAIIAAFVGVFGAWSWLAPLSTAAIAPGQILAEGNRRVIQHLEGGIIREFQVRDGDAVEAGQVLLRLDDAQSGASLDLLRGQSDSLRALDARLSAELAQAGAIAFPEELLARRSDPRVAEALAGQEAIFANRRRAFDGQLAILRQRIQQLNAQIAGAEGQVAGFQRQAALLSGEIKDVETLVNQGYMPRPRLLSLQREHARVMGDNDRVKGEIARNRQSIGETELQITQLRNNFLNEAAGEQRDVRQRLAELEERLRAAADVQQRRDIVSPVAGTVTNLRVHTVGGILRAGEPILDIVPRNEALIVEARIHPTDIDIVAQGLPADVRLTAFKQRTVPLLHGTVAYVAADVTVEERTNQSYYRATVQISADELARVQDVRLTPGMPAEVMIRSGERTLFNYLVQPLTDSMHRAFREQ